LSFNATSFSRRPDVHPASLRDGARGLHATGDERQFSALIGEIYDAAVDPSLWVSVLARIAHFVGGPAAVLFAESAARKSVYDYGTDPHYRQLYLDHYINLDPATTGRFSANIDEPIAAGDIIPYHEFLATRFYREWARPQRLVDFVACVLDKSTTSTAMIRVFRHERDGMVDEQARQRMRLIGPHVRHSVLAGRLIDLKTAETATYAGALDGLSAGMFLVDARARIVHANIAGQVILETGGFLRAGDSRVTDETLRGIFAAVGSRDDDVGIKGITVPLTTRAGERYVAHILPLPSGARRRARASLAFPAVAALFVCKAPLESQSLPEAIAESYRLTRAELCVLRAIVELGSVPDVAQALGIAASTVRTHVARLFEKTGVGRHADLVKVVAGFCNPLVS
jgi:DNA-binding CsgD family transcriptional regulator